MVRRGGASGARGEAAAGLGVAPPRLCLDFVNTEGVERNSPPDRLESLDLFLEWTAAHGLTDEDRAEAIGRRTATAEAESFLAEARELREALYGIFGELARGESPPPADLAVLERRLRPALRRLRLGERDGGFEWRLPEPPREPAELLWPIALAAADLLRSELLERVKECDGETCSWMFIDESRNRSRRWCDMADCGNRAKARRFHRRHRRSGADR